MDAAKRSRSSGCRSTCAQNSKKTAASRRHGRALVVPVANESNARSGPASRRPLVPPRSDMLDPPFETPEEQVRLGGEVGVRPRLGVARLLGDLVHRLA